MSSFYRATEHPRTKLWESAHWRDDYFGHHHYGVIFQDGTVYDPWGTTLRTADLGTDECEWLNVRVRRSMVGRAIAGRDWVDEALERVAGVGSAEQELDAAVRRAQG